MKKDIKEYFSLAEKVLSKIGKRAQSAEVFISDGQSLEVEVRNSSVETLCPAASSGVAVRVIRDQRLGFAYASGIEPEGINSALEAAIANAGITDPDESLELPSPADKYPDCQYYDEKVLSAGVQDKISKAMELERIAKKTDSRIKKIESARYQDYVHAEVIVNSRGIRLGHIATYCVASLTAIAEDNNDAQIGGSMRASRKYDGLDISVVGREAAQKAAALLGAKPISTRKTRIVLDPPSACEFLSLISSLASAEEVQKGKSLFAGRINNRVASDCFNIVDDGTLADGISTSPADSEGVPSKKKSIIERGMLKNYLFHVKSAKKAGTISTGNGMRASYKSLPGVGPSNFFVQPGSQTTGKLIAGINNGIYVMEMMGMHTANPVSGDFSVGISGRMIENGQLTSPIRGMVMAGNLAGTFTELQSVGSDLVFFGNFGSPTLFLGELMVSGND